MSCSGRGSGSSLDSQAVVMAMTASGLAALGLSHIRHSVKLLFAIARRGKREGEYGKGMGAGRWGSGPLQIRTHPTQVSR